MQTASCIQVIILEESRLHWVIASLSVIKSSASFIFVSDFWLCTELALMNPMQMMVFETCRKAQAHAQCEAGRTVVDKIA